MTRLCEREDFPDLLATVADDLGINPAIVEKDYFVTEALRLIARDFGELVLFKGGTSSPKGWKLIERFSEDIDLYVQEDTSSSRATQRRLKAIAEAVSGHPALRPDETRKQSTKHSRIEFYEYAARVGIIPGIHAAVMLEAGIQSGDYPAVERPIQSLLGEALDQAGVSGGEDQAAFTMRLLHFRRTCVEKLFTLHDRVERLVRQQGQPLGSFARHYYDVYCLLQQDEVTEMLRSAEYVDLARDYESVSSRYFPGQVLPPGMELRHSPALFPDTTLREELRRSYNQQCTRLCYQSPPPFDEVLGRLESVRERLVQVPDDPRRSSPLRAVAPA